MCSCGVSFSDEEELNLPFEKENVHSVGGYITPRSLIRCKSNTLIQAIKVCAFCSYDADVTSTQLYIIANSVQEWISLGQHREHRSPWLPESEEMGWVVVMETGGVPNPCVRKYGAIPAPLFCVCKYQ